MVPAVIVPLPAIPRTPNGKVDRAALPAPEQGTSSATEYVPPQTVVEEMIVEMWSEVLGLEKIGVTDNFFDLGGHSLKATQVLARVEEAFGVELPVRSLLEAPTILGLAEAIAYRLMEDADEETVAALLAEEE